MIEFKNIFKVFIVGHLILLQIRPSCSQHHARIVGGTPTTIAEAPFTLQLRVNGEYVCSATLVDDSYAITAAHCFNDIPTENYRVIGGATTVLEEGTSSRISKLFIHTNYARKAHHADIAVIKLEKPLVGPLIRPAPICSKFPQHGDTVQVYGWGQFAEDNYDLPIALHTINASVVDTGLCHQMYGQRLTASMFCAGAPGKDACSGDSGGPLIIDGEHCGVVSWGIGCGRKNFPGVYTSIPHMMSFVRAAMAN